MFVQVILLVLVIGACVWLWHVLFVGQATQNIGQGAGTVGAAIAQSAKVLPNAGPHGPTQQPSPDPGSNAPTAPNQRPIPTPPPAPA